MRSERSIELSGTDHFSISFLQSAFSSHLLLNSFPSSVVPLGVCPKKEKGIVGRVIKYAVAVT